MTQQEIPPLGVSMSAATPASAAAFSLISAERPKLDAPSAFSPLSTVAFSLSLAILQGRLPSSRAPEVDSRTPRRLRYET